MTGDDKKTAEEITDDELKDVEGGAYRSIKSISTSSRSSADGQTAIDTFTYTITDGNGAINTATINLDGAGLTSKKR